MQQRLLRTELLLGKNAVSILEQSHVLIVGLGGVGGYALEALARSGIGRFTLVDSDKFEETNLNRQILCTTNTIGKDKTAAAKERLSLIDKDITIETHTLFFDETNISVVFDRSYDVVVDAIDSVDSKCLLLKYCYQNKIPIVSSMGAGFKKDPTKIKTADLSQSYGDPLAKRVRQILSKEGITSGIPCVFSPEKPIEHDSKTIASLATVTGSMGLALAQLAIDTLLKKSDN